MKTSLTILAVFVLSALPLRATVIINEILVNEPGTDNALEWIELYNNGGAVDLLPDFWYLRITQGTDVDSFPLTASLGSGQFVILSADTSRFLQQWSVPPPAGYNLVELPVHLSNGAGSSALYRLGSRQSQFSWGSAGADAVSWERVGPLSDSIAPSLDPRGATPGEVNSNTPVARDLALSQVDVQPDSGSAIISFKIVNRSVTTISDGILELYYADPGKPYGLGDLIAAESVGDLDSAYSLILIGRYDLTGIYQSLAARVYLTGDLRTYNDRIDFTGPGAEFPPVLLSEFLANPTEGLTSEWVEVKNVSSQAVDLDGWQLGDSLGLVVITSSELIMQPGEYLVLAEDTVSFLSYYRGFTGRYFEPANWRGLNNGGDSVRLVDRYGLEADAFYYSEVYSNNRTWARGEDQEDANRWGRSVGVGGTPGAHNEVQFPGEPGQTLEITIEPRIFSPDGNGFQDTTVIVVRSSEADAYTLKIYDSNGRLVRTLEDGASGLAEKYVWNGRTDGGERLPIGIYILYFEAHGVESAKKTLVIAR